MRDVARAAGLGDGFNGHSRRIGMAPRIVEAESPNSAVQRQGRWKHGDMVATTLGARCRADAEVANLTLILGGRLLTQLMVPFGYRVSVTQCLAK